MSGGGLAGLTGLGPQVIPDPGATAEEVHGGPANPAHGDASWSATPRYAWQSYYGQDTSEGAATPAQELIGTAPGSLPAGTDRQAYIDPTSTGSHGAPWPSMGIDNGDVRSRELAAIRQSANQDLHAMPDRSMLRRIGRQLPANQQMELAVEADYVSSGESLLQPVPNQLRGNFGFDRVQGYAPINGYGFDSAHVRRPRRTGLIPGNFAWLTGSQRPMVVTFAGRQSWPVGPGSPFQGQDPGTGSVDGSALTGLPPTYTPPPTPSTGPQVADAAPSGYTPSYGGW